METVSHPRPRITWLHFRPSRRARRWLILAGFVLLAGLMTGIWLLGQNWPFRYRKIHPLLEDVFGSKVIIARYHRTYFPHPGFIATGITLRRDSAPDQPSIGTMSTLFVQGRWADFFLLRDRVQSVDVTGLHLVLPPPGSRAAKEDFPQSSSSGFTGPETEIGLFQAHDAVLDILRDNGKRITFPFLWLRIANMHRGHAMQFDADMDNALPYGRILASGSFGPLNPRDISQTPVSGRFTFDHVHLSDLGELHGTLNSSGQFHGMLGAIRADAKTETPDFAVSDGRPIQVTGSVQCIINGLNGDVAYRSLEARTGSTVVHATGVTAGTPGKSTHLEVVVEQGRVEDVLRPFLASTAPIAGPIQLHARAYLAPTQPDQGFLDRLHVAGAFDIPAEKLTEADLRKELAAFSLRAQGAKVPDPPKGTPPTDADVISSLQGTATIEKGIVRTSNLRFQVAGAKARLSGTFNFDNCAVHLTGMLATHADLSGDTTGFKSILLLPLDPFFKKHRHGAVIPIAVTGTPGHYKVAQDITHSK